jgi:hypothetical protein
MARLRIIELPAGPGEGYQPKGSALELWRCKAHEVMIAGPAETGKTFACCQKLDGLLWKYPGAQAVMIRKTYKSLVPTAWQTYHKKVLGEDTPCRIFGGQYPQHVDYPNGSKLWLAGLDTPGKALSSERDFVYVNQAEELSGDDWGVLTSRATGRAGNSPYPQVMGDCNPGPPHHWIKHRPGLLLLESRHEDNPTLHDGTTWTEQGRRTLAVLDALPGVLRERLRFGRWVSAEGTVYQFDARIHLLDPFAIPPEWPRIRSIDFGYSNPFCCLWLALDPDGRLYVYRELYMTGRTVRAHAEQINRLSQGEGYMATVADHDAEDRATLAECGIHTLPATKALSVGIQAVELRLQVQGDGKPRLFVLRNTLVERDDGLAERRLPVCLEQEFDAYSWPKAADGRPVKEVPIDLHNHAMDALRYAVMWADNYQRVGRAVPEFGGRSTPAPKGVYGGRRTDGRKFPKW